MRLQAAFVIVLMAGCGSSGGSSAELLPDLVQSEPRALTVYREGDTWRLAFLSAVENDGAGPMLLVGRRPDASTPAMTVEQLVRRADGSTTAYPVEGEIRFVHSETHRHWHFLDFERYDLLPGPARPSDGTRRPASASATAMTRPGASSFPASRPSRSGRRSAGAVSRSA